jgi:hypothetical protein
MDNKQKSFSKNYYINGNGFKYSYWHVIDDDKLDCFDGKHTDYCESYIYDRNNCSPKHKLYIACPPGIIGPTGAQGIPGAAGPAGGLSAVFAYIYSTQAQSVSNAGSVLFNNPTTTSAPIAFTAYNSTITLSPGIYLINFQVSVGNVGGSTWGIAVNNAITQPFSYTNLSGNSQVWGETIISITTSSTISIVNNSGGGSINLVNGIASTTNTSVSASVTILKLN